MGQLQKKLVPPLDLKATFDYPVCFFAIQSDWGAASRKGVTLA
jgi:hypothetical protein